MGHSEYEIVNVPVVKVPQIIEIVDNASQNVIANLVELNILDQKLPVILSYPLYKILVDTTNKQVEGQVNGTQRGVALELNAKMTNQGAAVMTGEVDFTKRDIEANSIIAKELAEKSKETILEMQESFERVFEEFFDKGEFGIDDLAGNLSREGANVLLNGLLNPEEVKQIQDYIKLNLDKTSVPSIIGGVVPFKSLQIPVTKLINDALLKRSGEYEHYHASQDAAIDLISEKIRGLIGSFSEGDKTHEETLIGKLIQMSLKRTHGDIDKTVEMAKDHTMAMLQALLDTTNGTFSGQLFDYANLQKNISLNSLEKITNPREFLNANPELFEHIFKVYSKYGQVTFDPRVVLNEVVFTNGYILKAGTQVGLNIASIAMSYAYEVAKDLYGSKQLFKQIVEDGFLSREKFFDLLDGIDLFRHVESLDMSLLRKHPIFLKNPEGESLKGACLGADFTLGGHIALAAAYEAVQKRGKTLKLVEELPIKVDPFRKNRSIAKFA